jgi:antitoxin component HigA of HigAB toxin-antitoxin module
MVKKTRVYTVVNGQFDIHRLIEARAIKNEVEYERALIADRKLRLIAKEDTRPKTLRSRLRSLITAYERKNWTDERLIDSAKMRESDLAERFAERERQFIDNRKMLIKKKLKSLDLTQQDLGKLLGHGSKSYMSELVNGISSFSMKDLILISILLKIRIEKLIPVFISSSDYPRLIKAVKKYPQVRLPEDTLTITD